MPDALFTGANHICVVTADMAAAVRRWSDRYGIGPWSVYRYDASNLAVTLHGAPAQYEMRAALAQLGPHFRVELIEPLDDRSPYADSLRAHGGADHLHHVRLDVAAYEDAEAHLAGLGHRMLMQGRFKGGDLSGPELVATYFDTEAELGFTLEVVGRPEGFTMPRPEYVYP
jgi:methylmalonyl-CoA/ethylmalonyl-CoA epimerase